MISRDGRGQALIIFALLAVPLVVMLAMATDLGVAYAERRQTQSVADSGAVAAMQVLNSHLMAGNMGGVDSQVCNAVANVAANSSAGRNGYRVGNCPGAGAGVTIAAEYVDWNGDPYSPARIIGNGDPSDAGGIRLKPTRDVPTNFARVIGVNSLPVSTLAVITGGVVTGFDQYDGTYGPFAVWGGGDQNAACQPGGKSCLNPGSNIYFRTNQWPSDTGAADDLSWSVQGQFKGVLDRISGQQNVNVGDWIVTKNGNGPLLDVGALCRAGKHMYLPIITEGYKQSGDIHVKVGGFVSLKLPQNNCGVFDTPSGDWYGTVELVSPGSGAVIGGTSPSAGLPKLRATNFRE